MRHPEHLFLYEEILLLALRNEKGTVISSYVDYAIAGAVLAEFLLDGHISVGETKKQQVEVHLTDPTGDPVMDECLEKLTSAKKKASLKTWVSRLAGIKGFRGKAAQQLCRRGILRADEDKVLWLFTRKIYPEINPVPEQKMVQRLRSAILGDEDPLDPRTVVLISLAHGASMLKEGFDANELRARKKRIQQISSGDVIGKATKELVAACQAAVMISTVTAANAAAVASS